MLSEWTLTEGCTAVDEDIESCHSPWILLGAVVIAVRVATGYHTIHKVRNFWRTHQNLTFTQTVFMDTIVTGSIPTYRTAFNIAVR